MGTLKDESRSLRKKNLLKKEEKKKISPRNTVEDLQKQIKSKKNPYGSSGTKMIENLQFQNMKSDEFRRKINK